MTLAHFVVKNALRNRSRSILTVLSITFSMLLLTILMIAWRAFYLDTGSPATANRVVVRNRVSLAFLLPGYYGEKIRKVPGVAAVAPLIWFGGRYRDDKPENRFTQSATDPAEYLKVTAPGERSVPQEQVEAWQRDRTGALVDAELARKLGWKLGDHIFLKGTYFPVDLELTVRALYGSDRPNRTLYFPSAYLEEKYPRLKGRAWIYLVRVERPGDVAKVSQAIDDMFHNSPRPTKTQTEKAFEVGFVAMLGNVKAFILSIGAAVAFTILLVAANTMAMSIRERTREVAVLRTLGFSQWKVLSLFVSEAVALALSGGLCGVFMAQLLVQWLTKTPLGIGLPAAMKLTAATAVVAIGVAALVGFSSAVVPAYYASRLHIANSLRHIG